jgi:hypothetical protein
MTSIAEAVLAIHMENPSLSNDQVAEEVQRRIPGAKTSAASVSSIKSKAKKDGLMPQGSNALSGSASHLAMKAVEDNETDEDRSARIRRRYKTLERMAGRVVDAGLPSLIVSGPPGLGKSFTVEQVLSERDVLDGSVLPQEDLDVIAESGERVFDIISGSITAPGLYLSLWNMRNGGILVLDDTDDVFRDETCLNLLKAVLDSNPVRRVSYRKRAAWLDELGIPTSFEFKGSVVFCTNIDFEMAISKGSAMGSHFQALIDRSLYLSLTMRTVKDFIVRLRHVAIEDEMLVKRGLTKEEADEVMAYVEENVDRFYGLSLRLMHQIALCFLADPVNWRDDIEATKMRTF